MGPLVWHQLLNFKCISVHPRQVTWMPQCLPIPTLLRALHQRGLDPKTQLIGGLLKSPYIVRFCLSNYLQPFRLSASPVNSGMYIHEKDRNTCIFCNLLKEVTFHTVIRGGKPKHLIPMDIKKLHRMCILLNSLLTSIMIGELLTKVTL